MLDEMKESGRSEYSETVVKKKSSSGCLIIKKKIADRGFSDSSSRNLFNSSKGKKRIRVVGSDSESSEDLSETVRRKRDKFHDSVVNKGVYWENRDFEREKRLTNGLDVFEFDEYDGFDERAIRKDVNDGRHRFKLYTQNDNQIESRSGGRRMILDKRKDFHYGTENSRPTYGSTSRFETEDDDSHLPLSALRKNYRTSSDEPIRLQGKNGVLKVMVNKNKQIGVSRTSYDHTEAEDLKEHKLGVLDKKKLKVSDKNSDYRDAGASKSKEKVKLKFLKPNESHTVRQFKSFSKVKNGGPAETPSEKITRVKGKESKVKRGSGTEKQLLREKIKNMLLAAGWTIDYRPRRNRDYLDAVYNSPSGTAYWSIIKAYEALQKEENNVTPLPDEILGKLTRQTRKKMEREMKKKRKNEGGSRNSKSKKGRLDEASEDSDGDSSDTAPKIMVGTNSQTKSGKIGRCTLLVRSSNKGLNSENDGFGLYSGKRTILSWLIDSGTVHMSEHVQYMNHRKTRILQKGWITKDGIHCGCCSKIVSVLKFEIHAGSKLRQPFPNIFSESGNSLMQCQIDAWNKQGELERNGFYSVDVDGDDPNDDTCGLCGDGGDLICCDGCPSTFHQSCLDIQMLPQGDWHCPNCSCKYCEIVSGKTETSLLVCCLCEKKYHESCKPEIDIKPNDSNYPDLSFCGQKCQELYSRLQKLLGVKHELDSGFSWSLLHRSDISNASSVELPQMVECNSMLAVAMSVMDECFLPVADRRSGINLIRNVVFNCGSNVSRVNYNGFFTAILERGDEVLCAASIRIHGTQLAEMPFIGTRHIYRRQGMCHRLLSAIESALSSLQVEKLFIPAVAEHMNTWTDVFGFHPLEESHKQELKSMNMLVFPGTDMLQKPLVKQGKKIVEVEANKESDSIDSHSDSYVEEIAVQNGDGSNLVPPHVHHPDTPCEPKLQISGMKSVSSVDVHTDSRVEGTDVRKGKYVISLEAADVGPVILESGKVDVKEDIHIDSMVEVIDAQKGSDFFSHQAADVSPVILESGKLDAKEDIHTDSVVEGIDVQKGIDFISLESADVSPIETGKLDAKEDMHNESKVEGNDMQKGSDAILLQAADVSPVIIETEKLDAKEDVHIDSKVEGIAVQKGGDFISLEAADVSPVILETGQLDVKEDIHIDSMVEGIDVQQGSNVISLETADVSSVILETGKLDVKEDKRIDVQKGSDVISLEAADAGPVILDTGKLDAKEDIHIDSMVEGIDVQKGSDVISLEVDDCSPDILETGKLDVKEDMHIDAIVEETDVQKGSDVISLEAADVTPVIVETGELDVKEDMHTDSMVEGTDMQKVGEVISLAAADCSPVILETGKLDAKEDIHIDSGVEGITVHKGSDDISLEAAHVNPVIAETGNLDIEEDIHIDSMVEGMDMRKGSDVISLEAATASQVVVETGKLDAKVDIHTDSVVEGINAQKGSDVISLQAADVSPVIIGTQKLDVEEDTHTDSMVEETDVQKGNDVISLQTGKLEVKEDTNIDSMVEETDVHKGSDVISLETGKLEVKEDTHIDSMVEETDVQRVCDDISLQTGKLDVKEDVHIDVQNGSDVISLEAADAK